MKSHVWNTLFRKVLKVAAVATIVGSCFAENGFAQSLSELQAKGRLTVAVMNDGAPWGSIGPNGKPVGFDVDIANMLGASLKLPVELVPVSVPNRIPELLTNKVDVVIAQLGMYPDRLKVVQFSKPYAGNQTVLIAEKSVVVKSDDDMKKLRIGLPRASAQDTFVTKRAPAGTVIQRFDDDASTIQALVAGQVDAVGGDSQYLLTLRRVAPSKQFEVKTVFNTQFDGIAIRKNQPELLAKINTFIDQIKQNGELNKASQKWFGTDMLALPADLKDVKFD
ncbi:transporter substrate-binding domain-containing protein [Paraburkholderia sp. EG285A]|uniref:transporter substrate-binding domain-containing protein n=1 Tax=Paraburkholderia sp. EG285A TaxID=3237009 RepID=UPI0034D1B0B4